MIPRTLVPEDVSPPPPEGSASKPRRLSTTLDSRALIPKDLPVTPLEGGTTIPAHVPLEVLATRTLVPRDLPAKQFTPENTVPPYAPLSILDSRVVVPVGLPPAKLELPELLPVEQFADVIEPDVIMTGEVNLLPVPVTERPAEQGWMPRVGSIVFHVVVLLLLLFQPKLFPYRPPTQTELEMARRQLGFIYLPPGVLEVPKEAPRPEPPSAQIRVDPRILRQIAPPNVEPSLNPGIPAPPQPELPNAPRPPTPPTTAQAQPEGTEKPKITARLEPPQAGKPPAGLVLPRMSPGRALEESAREALQDRGAGSRGFADPIPPRPGGSGGAEGNGGRGYLGGNLEVLTPLEGVDFSNYFARLLASVRRNWYAVMPESAWMGEKGRVVIQFHILKDGNVPYAEPVLVSSSGKEPLDRAAMSAIHASSPFERLPPAFSGPYIELRFTFLYNLPLDYQ